MKVEPTYTIQIWVGLRCAYGSAYKDITDVRKICDDWVNEIKDCVTITPTEFRYVDGSEPGVIVGYIRYPRFPLSNQKLRSRALILAEKLRVGLQQIRVSVVTPELTYLLEDE